MELGTVDHQPLPINEEAFIIPGNLLALAMSKPRGGASLAAN